MKKPNKNKSKIMSFKFFVVIVLAVTIVIGYQKYNLMRQPYNLNKSDIEVPNKTITKSTGLYSYSILTNKSINITSHNAFIMGDMGLPSKKNFRYKGGIKTTGYIVTKEIKEKMKTSHELYNEINGLKGTPVNLSKQKKLSFNPGVYDLYNGGKITNIFKLNLNSLTQNNFVFRIKDNNPVVFDGETKISIKKYNDGTLNKRVNVFWIIDGDLKINSSNKHCYGTFIAQGNIELKGCFLTGKIISLNGAIAVGNSDINSQTFYDPEGYPDYFNYWSEMRTDVEDMLKQTETERIVDCSLGGGHMCVWDERNNTIRELDENGKVVPEHLRQY